MNSTRSPTSVSEPRPNAISIRISGRPTRGIFARRASPRVARLLRREPLEISPFTFSTRGHARYHRIGRFEHEGPGTFLSVLVPGETMAGFCSGERAEWVQRDSIFLGFFGFLARTPWVRLTSSTCYGSAAIECDVLAAERSRTFCGEKLILSR